LRILPCSAFSNFRNESVRVKLNPVQLRELLMRQFRWLLSIAPNSDETVYLVADNSGRNGSAWCEADLEAAVETVIQDLLAGEYRKPIRIVAFNTAERWSEDVSEDIAGEIQRRCNLQPSDVPSYLQEFVDRYSPQDLQQFSLRLV
jgi:hypothetical protein